MAPPLALSKRLRRLRMGLATLLGVPQGYFIPYRYAAAAENAISSYPEVEAHFAAREAQFAAWLGRADELANDLRAIGEDAQPPEPRWGQSWFPRLDAAMAYVFVRSLAPRRIVEVGSGHSTRFCIRALRDGGLEAEVAAIDPAPRADISRLPLTLHRCPLQEAPAGIFDELAAGDLVMIDSSHILMPGTDLDFFLGRLLPRLPAGVYLHFHDVFLPDPYPEIWAWRGYNEQQALLPLLFSGGWVPEFASHYVQTRMRRALDDNVIGSLPCWRESYESSLWLRKQGADEASRETELS